MPKILNRTRQIKVFSLPHDPYCRALGICKCKLTKIYSTIHNPKTGEKNSTPQFRRLPSSIVFLAGRIREVDQAVLKVDEIRKALFSADLVEIPEVKKEAPLKKSKTEAPRKSKKGNSRKK